MAVRNQRLYAGQLTASGVAVVYTVPSATWVLVKAWLASNPGGSSQPANIGVQAGAGGVSVDVVNRPASNPIGAGGNVTVATWVALNPGDLLYVNMLAAGVLNVWLAGAVLT